MSNVLIANRTNLFKCYHALLSRKRLIGLMNSNWPGPSTGSIVAPSKVMCRVAEPMAASACELASANKRVEQELAASRSEHAQRLADAERRGHQIIEEAKLRATDEAAKIVAAAKTEANQQMMHARDALRDQVAALAVKGAEQILRKEVSPAVHADLLSRLKTEL